MIAFNKNIPTKELFLFLKYNLIPQDGTVELSKTDEELYEQFISKIDLLNKQFYNNDNAAKATMSSLFTMFGFNRHYCSMTGQPIIGQYFKIGGKIVSREAYEAHKIIQEIEKNNDKIGFKSDEVGRK